MIYEKCSNVQKELVFQAFKNGFSDYPIPFQHTMDFFFDCFFNREGNQLEHSFIALYDDSPIGLIMGGIREFDFYRNLRCGTLCILPEYRGQKVADQLFELFLQNAKQEHCERISLEVLADNHRAIRFYKKKNFEIHNKLLYYHVDGTELPSTFAKYEPAYKVTELSPSTAASFLKDQNIGHINWQNDTTYFLCDPNVHCYQYANPSSGEIKGVIAISQSGHIYQIWVVEDARRQGIATALLLHAFDQNRAEKISLSFPDNLENLDFLSSLGFIKDSVEQFEMFHLLS